MKRLFLLLVSIMMLSLPIMADHSLSTVPASEENDYALCVKEYMKLSNMKNTFENTLAATYVQMKDALNLSEAECVELATGMTDWIYDDLVELCIPIYKKYFTLQDIQQLCDFMRTPAGQKFAKFSGNVSTEMMGSMSSLTDKMQNYIVKYMEKKK